MLFQQGNYSLVYSIFTEKLRDVHEVLNLDENNIH